MKPKIGETIRDDACGSAGFLCESFDYLKSKGNLTTKDLKTLQERTFYGKEKKSLAYVIAIMNMILHGIEAPNIIHTNTLSENLADIQDKDRCDIVMVNPPFGGTQGSAAEFPIRRVKRLTRSFSASLHPSAASRRCGSKTFLPIQITHHQAKCCWRAVPYHTDCPGGTFLAPVLTVVFYEKGTPTRKIGTIS